EVYGEELVNLSIRGSVGSGNGALIAGFVLDGPEPVPILARAAGPALSTLGVAGVLPDPVLRVYRHRSDGSPELIAENDDWSASDTASLTAGAAARTGAFPFAPDGRDAAILLQ